MKEVPRLQSDTSIDNISGALAEAGCVIVESLLGPDLLADIDRELPALLDTLDTNNTEFSGLKTKRYNGLLSAVPACQCLAEHAVVMGVLDQVLLPNCIRYQLNYDGVMHLMPGETPQPLHRDGGIYPISHPTVPYIVACMWAQSEFTAANGGTNLVPGSHQWPQDRTPETSEVVPAIMPRGSLLIYTGGIYHGAGENRSNGPRTGLSLQYNYAWLRQELNMYLTYPPEVAKTFSGKLQRLIGYDLAGPYLGFINDGSPQLLLEDDPCTNVRERSSAELQAGQERVGTIGFADDRR